MKTWHAAARGRLQEGAGCGRDAHVGRGSKADVKKAAGCGLKVRAHSEQGAALPASLLFLLSLFPHPTSLHGGCALHSAQHVLHALDGRLDDPLVATPLRHAVRHHACAVHHVPAARR